jgi:hypothetical protein
MKEKDASALKEGIMGKIKICSQCFAAKSLDEFYQSHGYIRSACKECTKSKNHDYQKKNKVWNSRYENCEQRRIYQREYYEKNKEKFAKYRKQFIESHPDYHREYYLNNKEKFA